MRWRAVGTCFCQQATLQNRSFIRPVLHEATVHRIADAPGAINLRHVAQARLAMTLVVARAPAVWAGAADFDNRFRNFFCSYLRKSAARTAASTLDEPPRAMCRTTPPRSITTECGIELTL